MLDCRALSPRTSCSLQRCTRLSSPLCSSRALALQCSANNSAPADLPLTAPTHPPTTKASRLTSCSLPATITTEQGNLPLSVHCQSTLNRPTLVLIGCTKPYLKFAQVSKATFFVSFSSTVALIPDFGLTS